MPDFGLDVNVGAGIGIGGTGFGKDDATVAIGGYMDMASPEIDAPSRDVLQGLPPQAIPDERSLLEQAAGWAVNKAQAKIENMVNNPIATAVNIAFGAVPVVGAINSLSGAFGGPTVGALAQAAVNGQMTPGTPVDVNTAIGNQEPDNWAGNPKQIRYFRYRNGQIESRVVDTTPASTSEDYEYVSGLDANYSR